MNLKKFFVCAVVMAVSTIMFSSCKSDSDEPEKPSFNISENIIGNWLLSSSTADEWATYEFTSTSRVKVSLYANSKLREGSGYYWVDEEKEAVSASYDFADGTTEYIDWLVDDVKTFQIDLQLYDDNEFVANAALFRILSTITVEIGETKSIDFKAICGTTNVSDLHLLKDAVASIGESSEVTGKKIGSSYLTFKTANGTAAILVDVTPANKTFSELVVGAWIYDKPSEKDWQITTFEANGYVDVKWANPYNYNTIETANGYYQISTDEVLTFNVKTPYNVTFNQTWLTQELNEFIWTYSALSDNVSVGTYTGQRLLGTVTLEKNKTYTPDYSALTFGYEITGYSSHNSRIAEVDSEGTIKAKAKGRTYIDVKTEKGAGVYEVYVE